MKITHLMAEFSGDRREYVGGVESVAESEEKERESGIHPVNVGTGRIIGVYVVQ